MCPAAALYLPHRRLCHIPRWLKHTRSHLFASVHFVDKYTSWRVEELAWRQKRHLHCSHTSHMLDSQIVICECSPLIIAAPCLHWWGLWCDTVLLLGFYTLSCWLYRIFCDVCSACQRADCLCTPISSVLLVRVMWMSLTLTCLTLSLSALSQVLFFPPNNLKDIFGLHLRSVSLFASYSYRPLKRLARGYDDSLQ